MLFRSDVFLDLSFSNQMSEYIMMNRPVIASRTRTVRHYFSEDALAFFEPGDPANLARQMARLYGDAQLREHLARQARQEYNPICWEVMRKRYLGLMARLARTAGAESATAARHLEGTKPETASSTASPPAPSASHPSPCSPAP